MLRFVSPVLLAVAASATSHAADVSVDYSAYMRWLSSTRVGGSPRANAIEIYQDIAYVLFDWNDVFAFDVSDPTAPEFLGCGHVPLTLTFEVTDAYIYAGYRLFHVFERDAALELPIVGGYDAGYEFPAGERITEIVADGDVAYLLLTQGLAVMDVSDPAAPALAGYVELYPEEDHGSAELVVHGDIALVAHGHPSFLEVVDVSDPTVPALLRTVALRGETRDIAAVGSWLYVGTAWGGVQVVDISDPAHPEWVYDGVDLPRLMTIAADASRLYAGMDRGEGITAFDVTEPMTPVELGTYRLNDGASDGFVEFELVEETLHVIDRELLTSGNWPIAEGYTILDVAAPEPVPIVGTFDLGANPWSVGGEEGFAYVAMLSALRIVDISDPDVPKDVATLPYVGDETELYAQPQATGSGLVAVIVREVLHIADVSDPAAPVWRGRLGVGDAQVAVGVEYVYLVDGSVLEIVDILDPDAPAVVGSLDLPQHSQRIDRSGDLLFVYRVGTDWLHVIDAADPTNPFLVESLPVRSGVKGVVTDGGYMYVAIGNGPRGFDIYDMSTWTLVSENVQHQDATCAPWIGFYPQNLFIDDRFVYVDTSGWYLGQRGGVQVYDLADPVNPEYVGGAPFRVHCMAGDVMVGLASYDDRIEIYPKHRPGPTPVLVTGVRADADGGGVRVSWQAGDRTLRFRVHRDTGAGSGRVLLTPAPLVGDMAYTVVDATPPHGARYWVELMSEPGSIWFGPVAPDLVLGGPALSARFVGGAVEIQFEVPTAGRVGLDVYDVAGRRVAELLRGTMPAGQHGHRWSTAGEAAGVYFLQLRTPGRMRASKVVVTR